MSLQLMEHYLVMTADLEATRAFYVDALGFTEGYRPELGFPGYWLYLGDTPCIHIAEWATYTAHSEALGIPVTTPAPGTGAVDHMAFRAADFEAFLERITQRGLSYHRHDTPAIGLRQLFLFDPNGLKLEINFFAQR